MGEVMERGVIGMPFEMAMEGELSRRQFYDMAQRIFADRDALRAENERLSKGCEYYKDNLQAAYEDRQQLRAELAALRQPVAGEREAFDLWLPDFGEGSEDVAARRGWEAGVEWVRAALSAPTAGQKPVVFAVHSPEVGADPDSSLVDEDDAALYAPECVTPLYAAPTTAGQDVSALVEALEQASQAMKAAHDSLFTQCLSNPIKNAWGKPVNTTAVNELQNVASKADKALAAHKAGEVKQ